jgi:hypothetical protein
MDWVCLGRYIPEFGGVVLSYSHIKILQTAARIHGESPYCHFAILVQFIVFCPTIGTPLGMHYCQVV